MDKAAVVRWTVLGCALAATVGAILYPIDDSEPVLTPTPKSAPIRPEAVPAGAWKPQTGLAEWVATDSDPFAPRGWVAAPPAPVAAAPAVAAINLADVPPPPPPPPPLPYKFVGQMRDGSDTVVYLGRGDQVLLARAGEMLDGAYKVMAITANQIEFESVALGIRQTLPIPVQE